jgi:hypothetical protein
LHGLGEDSAAVAGWLFNGISNFRVGGMPHSGAVRLMFIDVDLLLLWGVFVFAVNTCRLHMLQQTPAPGARLFMQNKFYPLTLAGSCAGRIMW